jgi:hypothetical protein
MLWVAKYCQLHAIGFNIPVNTFSPRIFMSDQSSCDIIYRDLHGNNLGGIILPDLERLTNLTSL